MRLSRSHEARPQAAIRRKLLAAARFAKPAFSRSGHALPRAWFMTDPGRTPSPESIAERLPRGFGVIYRHFGAKDRQEIGRRLARACQRRRLVLLVSADPELARAIRADGVHWPEARLTGARRRSAVWIETASAHSRLAIARSASLGVDAVILSAVFPSKSASAGRPIGPYAFRSMTVSATVPVYALGGITSENAGRIGARAAGWAAIDAVMSGWAD
jgi:thiamine-phosphate pyrophosphorylase